MYVEDVIYGNIDFFYYNKYYIVMLRPSFLAFDWLNNCLAFSYVMYLEKR